MKKCCTICHTLIEDENNIIIDNSNTFYHRHCFHFTMDNFDKISEIGTLKNIKKKYTGLKKKLVLHSKKCPQKAKKIG